MNENSKVSSSFETMNFESFLERSALNYGTRTALSIFKDAHWQTVSFTELHSRARLIAAQLKQAGLDSGHRVAILAEASIDWVVHFFSIQLCGATAIPLDIKLTDSELMNILTHAEPNLVLASQTYKEQALRLRRNLYKTPKVLLLEDWAEMPALPPKAFQSIHVSPLRTAVICYTSGTSGTPKGVELSVRSLIFEAVALNTMAGGGLEKNEVLLSILPLNHLFGLSAGVIYCLYGGFEHCFLHSLEPEAIQKCLRERSITTVLAVPLYARTLMRGIRRKILDERGPAADRAFRALIKISKAVPLESYKNYFFQDVHAGLGGTLKKIICGGASLEPSVYDFFRAINIPVYIGYGLTETGPVITVNNQKFHRKHSVGKPLQGVEVKIEKARPEDRTGEILTRGPNLMSGYFKNPDLTAQTMTDDGWFRTGDLGWIDRDGYLFVRGRSKALIVLSSGKKVYPEEVETLISQSRCVKAVCVLGLQDPTQTMSEMVTAVVLPNDEEISAVNGNLNALEKLISSEVEKYCVNLAPFKRPTRIIVRTTPFVMTTSMKIKRDVLLAEVSEMQMRDYEAKER